MEETTVQSIDLSNIGVHDVLDFAQKIVDIYRSIIDAIKSVLKPILKGAIDSVVDKINEE